LSATVQQRSEQQQPAIRGAGNVHSVSAGAVQKLDFGEGLLHSSPDALFLLHTLVWLEKFENFFVYEYRTPFCNPSNQQMILSGLAPLLVLF
jgi:hypothetical protein